MEEKPGNQNHTPSTLKAVDVDAAITSQWTKSDRDLIWRTVAPKTTAQEFKLFLYVAHKFNLDPLTREVWCVKYKDSEPAQIFTGRDGFLRIAHEHKSFDGMETVVEKVNEPMEIVTYVRGREKKLSREWQFKASCTVWRKDMKHPFQVTIWEEEYNKLNEPWMNKPRTMLQKVAESQALRKAFSIHGLYAEEEDWTSGKIERADAIDTSSEEVALISESDRKMLHAKAAEKGYTHEDLKSFVSEPPYNCKSTKEIKAKDVESIVEAIEAWPTLVQSPPIDKDLAEALPVSEPGPKAKPKAKPKVKPKDKPKSKPVANDSNVDWDFMFAEAGIGEEKKELLKKQYLSQPGGEDKLRNILNSLIDQQIIGEGDGIL